MILIDDILISDDVIETQFVCNLKACKGACCIEGDSGAPIEEDEIELLQESIEHILPYLTPEGRKAIEEQGVYIVEEDDEYTGLATPLINGGACAYIAYKPDGVVTCGIEEAYNDGKINFRKPISCHLYPIRIKNYDTVIGVNYDEWDICSDACTLGKTLKVPVYVFLKDALIRKFGTEFYKVLEQAALEHENGATENSDK
ncbi:MAG TPA: DUF3109 family protein [Chitinophagales bacterium]|nr:DUF3109 family protein [Chitinophagales bacterium]